MDAVSPADEQFAEELRALRRRAYGPDADIGADPIAGARLAELERAHDQQHADPAPDQSVPVPGAHGEDRYESSPDTTSALSAQEQAAPTAHRLRRALPWITAAVAVLVAVGALAALYAARSDEQRPVAGLAALTEIPEGVSPPSVDQEQIDFWRIRDPAFVFHGTFGRAEVWSITGSPGRRCVAIVVEADAWGFHCAATTIDVPVDILASRQFMPVMPEGAEVPAESTVRFVLRGDVVEVYIGRIEAVP